MLNIPRLNTVNKYVAD